MTKILIDEAVVRQWLEAAYLAGFGATGEGYNAEYPFEGKDPEQDDNWLAHRDEYVRQALANETLDKMADNARELGLSYMEGSAEQYEKELEQPAPAQEPYGYFRYDIQLDAWVQNKEANAGVAFYTEQPEREWVGLTNEECVEIAARGYPRWLEFAQAVEAKLKEKNT